MYLQISVRVETETCTQPVRNLDSDPETEENGSSSFCKTSASP